MKFYEKELDEKHRWYSHGVSHLKCSKCNLIVITYATKLIVLAGQDPDADIDECTGV